MKRLTEKQMVVIIIAAFILSVAGMILAIHYEDRQVIPESHYFHVDESHTVERQPLK